jgi:hypothetical protein
MSQSYHNATNQLRAPGIQPTRNVLTQSEAYIDAGGTIFADLFVTSAVHASLDSSQAHLGCGLRSTSGCSISIVIAQSRLIRVLTQRGI